MATAIDRFEINLDHDIDEQYQYEPGETLRGHIMLALRAPIKVKAIQIQIKGEATVSWEDENGGKASQGFRADETYIDITQNLLEAPAKEFIDLQDGGHTYPIEYDLPPHLPSSFIGKYGSITYVVKATLKEDKRFGLSTMITSEPFLVLRKLDIQDSKMQQQREAKVEKRLWGAIAFCVSGKVAATLRVNRTGHLPGEDIFMDAEITNSSPRMVKAVQASIVMHSTFHAKHKSRYNTQIVNKKRDDWEMAYGEGRRWKNVRLTIPPYIPESRLDGCDIIDILYELLFKVEISGGHELNIKIPIIVGTASGTEDTQVSPRKETAQPKMWKGEEYIMPMEGDGTKRESMMNGDAADTHDLDFDINDEEAEKFRYPLELGDTRRNPIFNNN